MLKVIDGIAYERKVMPNEWMLTRHDLGGGHVEVGVSQVWGLVESHKVDPEWFENNPDWNVLTDEEEEEKRQKNRERAARRAKTRVRRLCKSMGLDALLTLTYRANVTDSSLSRKHLKEFVRRIRRVVPGFAYVAAFEKQKRGAWHIHLAVHALPRELQWSGCKVKSYSVVRAIWRSVTGELGGNIDQSRRKRSSQSSAAKIAGYLSKYMIKAFEDGDDWSNRFSASSHSLPAPVRVRLTGAALRDVIALAYVDAQNAPSSPWLSPYGDAFFLVIEPPTPIPPVH